MEVREILVANTKTQKRSRITTDATTLGELKVALTEAGIDYSGMTFTEGVSKTQLLDDSTPLPHDLMWKGQRTNNLVILLTNTKKNIASGAMSRKEAYQVIKDNNLQDAVKEEFGRNFTQVPTSDLVVFIENQDLKNNDPAQEETKVSDYEETDNEETDNDDYEEEDDDDYDDYYSLRDSIDDTRVENLVDSLDVHIAMLADNKALTVNDIKELKGRLDMIIEIMEAEEPKEFKEPVSTSDGSINDNDINDMINGLNV